MLVSKAVLFVLLVMGYEAAVSSSSSSSSSSSLTETEVECVPQGSCSDCSLSGSCTQEKRDCPVNELPLDSGRLSSCREGDAPDTCSENTTLHWRANLSHTFKYYNEEELYIELRWNPDPSVGLYRLLLSPEPLDGGLCNRRVEMARGLDHSQSTFRHLYYYKQGDIGLSHLHAMLVPEGWCSGPSIKMDIPMNCYYLCPGKCSCQNSEKLDPPIVRVSNVCLNEASSVATLDWEPGEPYYAPHPNITFVLRVLDLLPIVPTELGVIGKTSVNLHVHGMNFSKPYKVEIQEIICSERPVPLTRSTVSIPACSPVISPTTQYGHTILETNLVERNSLSLLPQVPTASASPALTPSATTSPAPTPSSVITSPALTPSSATTSPALTPSSATTSSALAPTTTTNNSNNNNNNNNNNSSISSSSNNNNNNNNISSSISSSSNNNNNNNISSISSSSNNSNNNNNNNNKPVIKFWVFATPVIIILTLFVLLLLVLFICTRLQRQKLEKNLQKTEPGKVREHQSSDESTIRVLILFSPANSKYDQECILENIVKALAEYSIDSVFYQNSSVRGSVADWVATNVKTCRKIFLVCNKQFAQEWMQPTGDYLHGNSIVYVLRQVIDSYVSHDRRKLEKFAILYLHKKDQACLDYPYTGNLKSFLVNPQDEAHPKQIVRFIYDTPTHVLA